jgi:hypothetical protein
MTKIRQPAPKSSVAPIPTPKAAVNQPAAPVVASAHAELAEPAEASEPVAPVAPSPQQPAVPSIPNTVSRVSSSSNNALANVNVAFVDGTVSCDQVPAQFGADPSMNYYLGGNGWLNSQIGNMQGDAVANLRNAVGCNAASMGPDQVMFCNYNCPDGMLPSQRPATQGINGESVGGLQCKNGLLYKTNMASDVLCVPPSNKVNVEVVNNLPQEVVICRTNYPGKTLIMEHLEHF